MFGRWLPDPLYRFVPESLVLFGLAVALLMDRGAFSGVLLVSAGVLVASMRIRARALA